MHRFSHAHTAPFSRTLTAALVLSALGLVACNSSDDDTSYVAPSAPVGVGYEETADPASAVTAYIDTGATNQRGKACMATLETNAGVRVAAEFL